MAKLKDGFYKQTAESIGSDSYVLLAGGGSKLVSDFAAASSLSNYYTKTDSDNRFSYGLNINSIYLTNHTEAGWIRIAKTTSYISSGIISIMHGYNNNATTGVTFSFNCGYSNNTNPDIVQLSGNSNIFTKVRIIKATGSATTAEKDISYIEVYYNTSNRNAISLRLTNAMGCELLTTYTVGSIPTNYEAYVLDLVNKGISANNVKANSVQTISVQTNSVVINDVENGISWPIGSTKADTPPVGLSVWSAYGTNECGAPTAYEVILNVRSNYLLQLSCTATGSTNQHSGTLRFRNGTNKDWTTILASNNTYINNGVITINGTSITPLTEHQSLSNYVTLNTDLTISGKKTFSNSIILNTDSTGIYLYGKCGIEKWSGYGPSLVAESGTDFWISNKSDRAIRYKILHVGNYSDTLDTRYYTETEVNNLVSGAKTYTDTKIANLVNSAPDTLDTLGEIAKYLQDNTVVGGLLDALSKKVNKAGDVMTGLLEIPGYLRITQESGVLNIVIGNLNSQGVNKPAIISGANGNLYFGYGNSWQGAGGTRTTVFTVSAGATLTYGESKILNSTNYGARLIGSDEAGWLLLGNDTSTNTQTGKISGFGATNLNTLTIYSLQTTFTGTIATSYTGTSWVSGMTHAAIMYDNYTALNTSKYHPILGVKTNGENVVNLGAYVNDVGFYGYKKGRTENSYDWRFVFNSENGAVTHSGTSITANKFITKNGTSSQFVKGDGSLDNTTYATSTSLGNYLPLTGGTLTGPLTLKGELYSGNYALNLQNSNIIGVNSIIMSDLANDAGEGILFKRSDGKHDSIWASDGVMYFSPNGTYGTSTNFPTKYTIYHTGNLTSLPANGGNADTVDNLHADAFKHVNVSNVSYTPNLTMHGGSTLKSTHYYKVSISNLNNVWTMLYMELDIKENYNDGNYGKLIIHLNKNNTNAFTKVYGYVYGNLSNSIKVYVINSTTLDIYVAGSWNYSTIDVSRVNFGDSSAGIAAKTITLNSATTLPSDTIEATIIKGLSSTNYTSYVNTTNFPGLDKTGTVTSVTVTGANGLSGSGTVTTSGTITLSNAGVRSTTINGNYLRVNTNGTNADLTIPYATRASITGDSTINMIPQYSNEINFGGTDSSTTLHFGYRATDSKPIPTQFIFGGSDGSSSIKANGFIKKGSSDSYVLLGGGDHKAESSLSVNYASNADKVDGYHAGLTNNTVAIFVPFPSWTSLKNSGYIDANYGTDDYGHPDEEFLKGICKWAIDTYPNQGDITLMGIIRPNSSGTCILHLYSSSGKDSTSNLPIYCRGQYLTLGGYLYHFGTNNSVWSYNRFAFATELKNPTNYYWANIPISATSSTSTNPTFATAKATTSVVTPRIDGYNTSGVYLYLKSVPTAVGSLGGAIGIGSAPSNYGMFLWGDGNGYGHIQVGRKDGTNTAYLLKLQEFGGSVNIGSPNVSTAKLNIGGSLFLDTGDATLKVYSAKTADAVDDGFIALQTCIDSLDGETHSYAPNYPNREVILLQPRGGKVAIGTVPQGSAKLTVAGDINLYNASGSSPRLIFQRGTVKDTSYDWDAYVYGGVFKLRCNTGENSTETWKDIISIDESTITASRYIYGTGFKKSGSTDSYALTGAGGHRNITNMTTLGYIVYDTNLMTTNTLAYWNGAYNSSGNSNLAYCKHGAFGTSVTKEWTSSVTKDSSSLITSGAIYNYAELKRELLSSPLVLSTGWYRVATLNSSNAGSAQNYIISIERSYNSPLNEHYMFAVSLGYNGDIDITLLSGVMGGHLITKIRVVYNNSGLCYFDFYIGNSSTYHNSYRIKIWGPAGTPQTPTAVSEAGGSTVEFSTVDGCKSLLGFTGSLTGNATTATSAGNADSAKVLTNYFSARPANCDLLWGDGSLRHFKATTSMTTSKPPHDAHVLHFSWDNINKFESLLAVSASHIPLVFVRGLNGTNWSNWVTLLGSNNYTEYTYSKNDVYTKTESDNRFYGATIPRTANTVLAAPNGSNGAATFRKLVSADIPDLSGKYLPLSGGTISNTSYGPLTIERKDSTNMAAIKFKNSSGDLGSIGMNTVNGNLIIYNAAISASRTILDSGNSTVSGGGSTWGSSITVNIGGTSKTLTIPSNPNTHWTTRIYAGASGTATNAATANPYLKVTDDNTYRNLVRFIGSGSTTVSSDANGNITISSTDTNTTYDLSPYFKYQDTLTSNVDFNNYYNGSYVNTTGNGSGNSNNPTTYGYLLAFPGAGSSSYYAGVQFSVTGTGIQARTHWNYEWKNWYTVLTSNNYTTYVTKANVGLGNVLNTAFYERSTTINGTAWKMAGTANSAAFTIYAPTTAGTSGQVLTSTGGIPGWTNQSSLSVGYASSAGSVAWANVTGKPSSFTPSPHTHPYIPINAYSFTNGCLVKLSVASASNSMISVHITGNAYSTSNQVKVINSIVEFYNYNDSNDIISYNATHFGYDFGDIKIFNYDDKICLWFKQDHNYMSFSVFANYTNSSSSENVVSSISNSAMPTSGVTRLKTITPKTVAYSSDLTWSNISGKPTITDTKNTAGSTNTSSAIYLIGATTLAANPQTYSHDTAYVGTDGCLYSNSTKVSVDGHGHSYLSGWGDTRSAATTPNDYNDSFKVVGIKTAGTTLGLTSTQAGSFATIIGWRGWGNSSGGYSWEIASTDKNRLYTRSGSTTSWNNGWNLIAYVSDIPTVTDYYWADLKIGSDSSTSMTPTFGASVRLNSSITGAGGNVSLELFRGTNASWKLLNSGGNLTFQCNWTTAVTDYYNVFLLQYNTGKAVSRTILPFSNNTYSLGDTNTRWNYVYANYMYASTAFYQSSDKKLKDNIQILSKDLLDKVYNVKEVSFNWKDSGKQAFGYIAQDYEQISDVFVGKDENGTLSLDYTEVLVAQIAALKLKIVNLEERLQILERS